MTEESSEAFLRFEAISVPALEAVLSTNNTTSAATTSSRPAGLAESTRFTDAIPRRQSTILFPVSRSRLLSTYDASLIREGRSSIDGSPPSPAMYSGRGSPKGGGGGLRRRGSGLGKAAMQQQGKSQQLASEAEDLLMESLIDGTTLESRVRRVRSLAPPNVLRYGKVAEDEMNLKDRLIFKKTAENAVLEDTLAESEHMVKDSIISHFSRRLQEHYKDYFDTQMLNRKAQISEGRGPPLKSITEDVHYDDYSVRPLAQLQPAQARLLRPFLPEHLGLRKVDPMERPAYLSPDRANKSATGAMAFLERCNEARRKLAKTTPWLRSRWQQQQSQQQQSLPQEGALPPLTLPPPPPSLPVDYSALLQAQACAHEARQQSLAAYDTLLRAHFASQAYYLAKLS